MKTRIYAAPAVKGLIVGTRLQDWPYTETSLSKCNLIIKSSIWMSLDQHSLDTLPAFLPVILLLKFMETSADMCRLMLSPAIQMT